MDDDFLWDCALHSQSNNRLDIIPDYEDDMRHFCNDNLTKASSIGATFHLSSTPHTTHTDTGTNQDIHICITESRGNGVLDIIGGELWEGALLLCVYILQNQHLFLTPDVLELGSGVGLPGLLLAQLKANSLSNNLSNSLSHAVGDITLTDNDPRVVANLNSSVAALSGVVSSVSDTVNDYGSSDRYDNHSVALHTKLLDWSVFAAHTGTTTNTSTTSTTTTTNRTTTLPAAAVEVSPICEVIMGCELCYAPYHAQCLAELLRHYLLHNLCKKVVICQMRDREGFAELLSRLDSMRIVYTIHEISDEQYELAQSIRCSKVSNVTSSEGAGGSSTTNTHDDICTTARNRADSEDNDVISKKFTFSASLCTNTHNATHNSSNTTNSNSSSGNGYSDHLLHSAKENFVFLTIG